MLFAKEFAKAILCQGKIKPCGECESCVSFNGNNNPDIIIVDEEENSIKTDTIKQMVKDVYQKPIKSLKKVYIVNNSENMTKEAQNSFLKTLEEPPEYVTIILITKNENLLLNTIKSRCLKISFNSLEENELTQILKEHFGISNVAKSVLEFSQGSVAKALMLNEKEDTLNNIEQTFTNIENLSIIDLLKIKDTIFTDKNFTNEILDCINITIFNKAKENIKYLNGIKIIEEAKDRLKKNSNYDMTIDNLLIKLWEEING